MIPDARLDVARAFENLFVASLLAEWAPRVIDAAGIRAGQDVVDVACGTGALARAVESRVGAAGSVTGLDADAGMVAVAAELAPNVHWTQGLAESLPFADRSFGTVVSQFGLMFFRDRDLAVAEMLRVVRPGGRLAVAVWDSLASMPAYATEVALLDRTVGTDAGNALRAPFALGDRGDLELLFQRAGALDIQVDTQAGVACFPSVQALVEADLRGWLPLFGIHLSESRIEDILQEAAHDLAGFVAEDGRAQFRTSAHIVTARRAGTRA